MRNKLFHGSIRKKLIILVLLSILPACAVLLGTELFNRQQAIKTAQKDTTTFLHSFSEIQRRISDSTRTLMQTVAAMPAIKKHEVEEVKIILKTLLEANPIYTNVILLDLQGNVLSAGKGDPQDLNFADRKQFKEAMSTGKFSAGEYVVGKTSNQSIFPFAMPVLNLKGTPQGAIIIGIDLSHYGELFERSDFPKDSFFGLCDHNGKRLFRYPLNPDILIGNYISAEVFNTAKGKEHPGTIIAVSEDNLSRIIAYEPIRLSADQEPYMYMFISLNQDKILENADSILTRGAITSILSVFVALAIAWIVGGKGIALNLEKLTTVVQKIAKDDIPTPSGIDYSDGEIGNLGKAFDSMTKLLHQREDERNIAIYRLSENEEQSRILLEKNPSGICLINPESLIIEFANPAFITLFDLKANDLGYLQLQDIHPKEDFPKINKIFQKHIQREISCSAAVPCVTKYGKRMLIDISSALVTIQGRELLACFFTDITARKKTEDELIISKDLAELANKSKDEFLANISHEVRTPLHGIMGMLQLLQDTSADAEQRSYMDTALQSSRNLQKVLDDLLDFSKIEAGKLELYNSPFNLPELIDQCVNLFKLQASSKGIIFKSHIDRSTQTNYRGDVGRIRQVLFNLLGNSIKFTETGLIKIEVYSLPHPEKTKDRLFFSIEDTGVGIPDDKIEHIFNSFTQVDGSLSRKYQGTGLGLPIVKRLVNLMGGNIVIESEVGVGTTILFCALVEKEADIVAPVKPQVEDEVPSKLLNILLVEDEMVNRITAQRLLEKMGHTVACAENGEECLEKLHDQPFDAILMDIQMPIMNGLEATRKIRTSQEFSTISSIPIIALTAHASQKDSDVAIEAGMNEYISKPFEKKLLLKVLHDLITP